MKVLRLGATDFVVKAIFLRLRNSPSNVRVPAHLKKLYAHIVREHREEYKPMVAALLRDYYIETYLPQAQPKRHEQNNPSAACCRHGPRTTAQDCVRRSLCEQSKQIQQNSIYRLGFIKNDLIATCNITISINLDR